MAITVLMLDDKDVILPTDFVRQLSLVFDGQSDHLATTATYGGGRINRLGWMLASEVCPGWIGRTVGRFNAAMTGRDRHATELSAYEFVRGDIPESHWEP